MFKKLLIANRGEIACRIMRSAQKLGLQTIAIYSDIDWKALHVQMADEAYYVGEAPTIESYLNRDRIIEIAHYAHADAIHPGYGFLSEDAEFAEKCEKANLIFVGPPATAIRDMGDKNIAKQTMALAGVPVVPEYQMADQKAIECPVLVKASLGGGGKGMRLVNQAEELSEAIAAAQREANASFGDSRVFLEKYLSPARHVEVQILFDHHGHGIHLFDRDCSIQRRHQKIIEEAPAPYLKESTRRKMAETALKAGSAIDYRGAGTVEFLVDAQENFYFMEMNTRLQVEHPVTEMITGLDLVEWQLRIASGEPLDLKQSEVEKKGCAIECRLYAENPAADFMPSSGVLSHYQFPQEETKTRIETGFCEGDVVSSYYDPLLAKLIVWGEDRDQAIQHFQQFIDHTFIMGVLTNLTLLSRIAKCHAFQKGDIDTHFIDKHRIELLETQKIPNDAVIQSVALSILEKQKTDAKTWKKNNEDQFSPWHFCGKQIVFWQGDKRWDIQVDLITKNFFKKCPIFFNNQRLIAFFEGEQWIFSLDKPIKKSTSAEKRSPHLEAPMSGILTAIFVKPGDTVQTGQRLLLMEAMKMEHTITAPQTSVIESVFFQVGDHLSQGNKLLSFAAKLNH